MNVNQFLYEKVIASTVTSWCYKKAVENKIIFEYANHVIGTQDCYFGTPFIEMINKQKYGLKNGLTYAINYSNEFIQFQLVMSKKYLKNKDIYHLLLEEFNKEDSDGKIILYRDNVVSKYKETLEINDALDQYLLNIEKFNIKLEHLISSKFNDEVLHEGKCFEVKLTKYERNKKARMKCIEYYGCLCKICGFDFKKVYGDNFEGIIQVHHITPLSEIKKDYIVDPINDLIPICPNCHVAIHSKEDGYYSVEEMNKKINKNENGSK